MHIKGDFPAEEVSPTLIFHPSNTVSNGPRLDYNPEISFLQVCWPFIITPQISFCEDRTTESVVFPSRSTQNTDIEKLMVWKIKKKGNDTTKVVHCVDARSVLSPMVEILIWTCQPWIIRNYYPTPSGNDT